MRVDSASFLYIYVVKVGSGETDIEHLREILHSARGLRAKAFVRNPQTFVIHAEADISDLLLRGGFSFEVEKMPVEKVGDI